MTRLPGGSTGILYLAVVLTATIASLAATAFHTVRADESSPPDPAIILIASETPTQRDLRFIRGLIDLRLYDMAANEAVKLIGRLSQSSATAEKNSPENVIVQTEAISLAIKATTSLWVLSDQAGQGRLEKSVVDLRRMVEGNQATESVFVWPESGDVSAYLRYAASILNDATSRAAVLRCQNQNSKAVEILQPLAGFDVPQWTTQARTTQARTTDDWNLGISPVERIMEYLFTFEQFREETILCGMVPRSTPRKALPNFASRLTPAEAAVFDAFVKYIDLRAARFDGRREEAAACLTALAENKVARFIPGIEAERLRLAILNGKAKEHFASTVQEFGKEAPFVQPLQDDMLTRALDDDRQFARFEFLLAIGKEKQSGPDIQQRITRQLEVVKSSCSPLVSRQVETLLGIS
ncbi:MAG: hypothetical protein PHQ75_15000, partial [Thermoguttaceae bacterium]|nr:hypothetical protein [Thermoguttaceae bacterium]